MAIATFYIRLDAAVNNYTGAITSVKAGQMSQTKPTAVGANSTVLKLSLDVPDSAFSVPELKVRFKDNPAPIQSVVAELQQWVADLSK